MNHLKNVVLAGGAVVTREHERRGTEIAIIHRQRYRDWTLPKGKLDNNETLPAAAVREVLEETGTTIRLGNPLDNVSYPIERSGAKAGEKRVSWWSGTALASVRRPPDDEVDVVAWLPVKAALARLTFEPDRMLVAQCLAQPATTPLVLVRHGKAMDRKDWSKADDTRPLTARGRRQARELVPLLAAFGVRELVSSSSTRCLQTVQPYAESASLTVTRHEELTEERGTSSPEEVESLVARLRRRVARSKRPLALSLHRPVLPHILGALDVAPTTLATGEILVVHVTGGARTHAIERHRAPA